MGLDNERERFEAWWRGRFPISDLGRWHEDRYIVRDCEQAWQGWQAAIERLSAPAEPVAYLFSDQVLLPREVEWDTYHADPSLYTPLFYTHAPAPERVLSSGKWSLADVGVTPMVPAPAHKEWCSLRDPTYCGECDCDAPAPDMQPGSPTFDGADAWNAAPAPDPTATECPRCKNDIRRCDCNMGAPAPDAMAAARYRWLRERYGALTTYQAATGLGLDLRDRFVDSPQMLDAAIDAAMKEKP